MLPSGVVGDFPSWVDNRAFSYFDYAITSLKTNAARCLHKVDMSPLVPMVVDVVGDFAEQNAFGLQNPVGFLHEGRISVGESVAILFWRAMTQSKARVEVLLFVTSLV